MTGCVLIALFQPNVKSVIMTGCGLIALLG